MERSRTTRRRSPRSPTRSASIGSRCGATRAAGRTRSRARRSLPDRVVDHRGRGRAWVRSGCGRRSTSPRRPTARCSTSRRRIPRSRAFLLGIERARLARVSPKIAMKSFEKQLNDNDRAVVLDARATGGGDGAVHPGVPARRVRRRRGLRGDRAAVGLRRRDASPPRWRSSTATPTRWCRCATARSSRKRVPGRTLTVWPGEGHLGHDHPRRRHPRPAPVATMPIRSMEDAVAAVRPRDRLAVPLGPGIPGPFLHALGERDDFEQLEVFGALLIDLYALFTKPGVRLLSGFYGPAERFLRDSGANVEFVPSDFRRFTPDHRVVPPARRRRRGRAARRRRLDEPVAALRRGVARAAAGHRRPRRASSSPRRRRTSRARSGSSPSSRTACTSTRSTFVVETDRAPYLLADAEPTADRAGDRGARPAVHPRRRDAADRHRRHPVAWSCSCSRDGDAGDFGVHSEMFTTGLMAAAPGRQGHQPAQGPVRRLLGHDVRSRHRRALRVARRQRRGALPPGRRRQLTRDDLAQPRRWSRSTARSPSTSGARSRPTRSTAASSPGIGGHEDFVVGLRPRARGPVGDLPAVDRHRRRRRSSRGSSPRCPRGCSSPRRATSSTSSSPSTASRTSAAAPSASARPRWRAIAHPDFRDDLERRAATLD